MKKVPRRKSMFWNFIINNS